MTTAPDQPLLDLSLAPEMLFNAWLEHAKRVEKTDATAMALATASKAGMPSMRMMLLKGADADGFVFHTNLESRKGEEIAHNPQASLLFYWRNLRCQIRVEGTLKPVSDAEADRYFASRSWESRIAAIASQQSRPLAYRNLYEQEIQTLAKRYANQDPPRPSNWSGLRLTPCHYEFWHDRRHRMHDRATWTRDGKDWRITRLYP